MQFYSKICLLIFRVEVEQDADFLTPEKKKRILILSNHTSFLDIFVLSALCGSFFVSKKEVGHYPIIGQIARLAGIIFFERTSSKERLRVLNRDRYHDTTDQTFYGRSRPSPCVSVHAGVLCGVAYEESPIAGAI